MLTKIALVLSSLFYPAMQVDVVAANATAAAAVAYAIAAETGEGHRNEPTPPNAEPKPKTHRKPKIQAVVFCIPNCAACDILKRTIESELQPAGWTIGTDAEADFVFVTIAPDDPRPNQPHAFPTTRLQRGDAIIDQRTGAIAATPLGEWINAVRVANPRE